jgi:prephenate dehydratase
MTKIGTLGPAGTFSEVALNTFILRFGGCDSDKYLFNSISSVFDSLCSGKMDKVVVPIENTINGKVESTLDELLLLEDYTIELEFTLPIKHCLFGKSPQVIDSVSYILSHYQPLGQCKRYISTHFPNAYQIVTGSTAEAARFLDSEGTVTLPGVPSECTPDNTVVIGSDCLLSVYDLTMLADSINDIQNNVTRFVVIGVNSTVITGKDKTSLVFTTQNNPGALYEMLGIFAQNNINLLSISSRPSKKQLGEYLFYVDVEGHCDELGLRDVFSTVERQSEFYKFLGSFPVGNELNIN